MPAKIVAGTKFIVNGITYTAQNKPQPIRNGRTQIVVGILASGRTQQIALPTSDSVEVIPVPSYHENSVRKFAAQVPTPNVNRMVALCESGSITWTQAYELACKSLAAGLDSI